MANEYMKMYTASLLIKKILLKTTAKHHYTHTGMAKNKDC